MDYLLDTTTASFLLIGSEAVTSRFALLHARDRVYSSVVTEGELLYGALRAPVRRRHSGE